MPVVRDGIPGLLAIPDSISEKRFYEIAGGDIWPPTMRSMPKSRPDLKSRRLFVHAPEPSSADSPMLTAAARA